MFKKFLSVILSVALIGSMSLITVTAEDTTETVVTEQVITDVTENTDETTITETEETTEATTEKYEPFKDYVYNEQMSAFDIIKIKRSLMSNDNAYTMEDYEFVRDFLTRKRTGGMVFAKKVVLEYDFEGSEINDTYDDPSVLDTRFVYVGDIIKVAQHTLTKEGCSHGGWMYDGVVYKDGQDFVIPDENVTFTPYWFNYRTITYLAGDYDDVVEYPSFTLQGTEGVGLELAASSRFTRPGYRLIGWKCDVDGFEYGVGARYIVPDSNVVFTAIWEKAEVTVVISAGNGKYSDRYTEKAYTGDEYVLPECTFTNGTKTFVGWEYDGNVYQPGETVTVPALITGQNMIIVGKWE